MDRLWMLEKEQTTKEISDHASPMHGQIVGRGRPGVTSNDICSFLTLRHKTMPQPLDWGRGGGCKPP